MPGVGLLCVIVALPDQAHLLSFFWWVRQGHSLYVILSVSVFLLGRELPVGQALIVMYMYANSNAAYQPVQYFSYYTFQTMNNKE